MLVIHNAFLQMDLVFEMVAYLQVMMHPSCNAQYIYIYICILSLLLLLCFFFYNAAVWNATCYFSCYSQHTVFFFCLLPAYSCFFFSHVYPANFTYPNN